MHEEEYFMRQLCAVAGVVLQWNMVEEVVNYTLGSLLGLRDRSDHLAVTTRINGFDGKKAIIEKLIVSQGLGDEVVREEIRDTLSHAMAYKTARDNITHMRPGGFSMNESTSIRHRGKIVRVDIKLESLVTVENHLHALCDELIEVFGVCQEHALVAAAKTDAVRSLHVQGFQSAIARYRPYRLHRLSLPPLPSHRPE